MRICISTSIASANVTMWYTFDDQIHTTLPNKVEIDDLSNLIIEARDKLGDYKERQSVLAQLEHQMLTDNNTVDDQLVLVTIVESIGIVFLAVLETWVLSRFISRKEMF